MRLKLLLTFTKIVKDKKSLVARWVQFCRHRYPIQCQIVEVGREGSFSLLFKVLNCSPTLYPIADFLFFI